MKNRILAAALCLALTFGLTACGGTQSSTAPESTPAESSTLPAAATTNTVDRAGNPIVLPEEVNTIMAATPATTQIILALGLGEKLVAVDANSAWMFPEVADLPAYDIYNPDIEQLMVLKPDMLFSAEFNTGGEADPFLPLVEAGVCVAYIPNAASIADIYADVRFIAACLGTEAEAEALLAETQATIDEVAALAAGIEEKKTVSVEVAALPAIYAVGEGTFINEILTLVGAENAHAGLTGYLPLGEEDAVAANPDVILTTVDYLDIPADQEILAREGWEVVAAVANGEVYVIDNNNASQPTHNIRLAIVEIAKLVYPEVYADLA